jgi:hypothetical protein
VNRPRLLGRRRSGPPSGYVIADAPVPLTSAPDGRTHLINAADHAHAIAHRTGRFTTRCGRTVLPTSLSTPPGPRCRDCHAGRIPAASPDRSSSGARTLTPS